VCMELSPTNLYIDFFFNSGISLKEVDSVIGKAVQHVGRISGDILIGQDTIQNLTPGQEPVVRAVRVPVHTDLETEDAESRLSLVFNNVEIASEEIHQRYVDDSLNPVLIVTIS